MSKVKLPIVVDLVEPIEFGDDTVDKVSFNRRPCSGDMRGVKLDDLTDVNKGMVVVCRISDLPVALKSKVDVADSIELVGVLTDFFDRGR
ncbi:MAG: phage tail assembly protein [Pseudodesulfovibrio sp.]|nr:phage tail assembly protein [Pseudodesulfovibrio sp.]